MKHFKIVFWAMLLNAVFSQSAHAQNAPNDPFEAMRKRMEALQKQMMQQFDSGQNLFGDQNFLRDTSFTFRFDTTITDGNGSFFFHFGNPKADSTRQYGTGDFWGFEHFFDDFFQQPFGQPKQDRRPDTLNDDDDLLPEERLRQEEQKEQKKAAPTPKKPKLKTIRV
ncbi:MAG: hypothetical protein IT269_06010 [Saprospiraceae bacterium]|nr:hypothetical protein [Saprospiraceae bacterium]